MLIHNGDLQFNHVPKGWLWMQIPFANFRHKSKAVCFPHTFKGWTCRNHLPTYHTGENMERFQQPVRGRLNLGPTAHNTLISVQFAYRRVDSGLDLTEKIWC